MGAPFDAEAAETEPGAGPPCAADLVRAAQLLRRIGAACIARSLEWDPIHALAGLAAGVCDCLPLTFGYAHFQREGVRFGPIPQVDYERPARPILGGTGLAVSAKGPHTELAQAVACFAASANVQCDLWPRTGGQPAHREAWRRLETSDAFYRDAKSSLLGPMKLAVRLRDLWHEATGNGGAVHCGKER
jgi:multiple sugar transport system substrate-binding protein